MMTEPDVNGWHDISSLPDTGENVIYWSPAGQFMAPAQASLKSTREERLRVAKEVYLASGEWPNVKYAATHWRPELPNPIGVE